MKKGLSKNLKMELKYHCYQYPEWKEYLRDIGHIGGTDEYVDTVGEEATNRVIYAENMRLVEECAKEVGGDIYYEKLLKYVTNKNIAVESMYTDSDNCFGRNQLYDMVTKFYLLLDYRRKESHKKHM